MTRVVNGIHVCNSRAWNIEQMLRVARTNGAVTILHHMMFPRDELVGQYGDVENAYWYNKLRWGWAAQGIPPAPERFIHVRLFQPNWRDFVPERVAQQAVTLLSSWRYEGQSANLWDDPFVGVSPCNEQNLEPVGNKEYGLHARWQLAFWAEIDRLIPKRRALSVLGAWAYGGDLVPDVPDSEYTDPDVRRLLASVDVLATHPYGHLEWPGEQGRATVDPARDAYWHLLRDFRPAGWRDSRQPGRPHDIGGLLAQVPNKPLLITESGTFVHSDPARTADTIAAMKTLLDTAAKSGRVLGATWFIWNSGPEHAGNVIWPNSELRDAMERLPDYVTTCRVPVRGQSPIPPNPTPNPAPNPTPPAPSPAPVVSGLVAGLYVERGDGWTNIARRMLGREPTRAEVSAVSAVNGNGRLTVGAFVRSPFHRAVRT